jgi:hypothetical protein
MTALVAKSGHKEKRNDAGSRRVRKKERKRNGERRRNGRG